jgi:hypothetical protein
LVLPVFASSLFISWKRTLALPAAAQALKVLISSSRLSASAAFTSLSTINPQPLWRFVFRRPCSTPARQNKPRNGPRTHRLNETAQWRVANGAGMKLERHPRVRWSKS